MFLLVLILSSLFNLPYKLAIHTKSFIKSLISLYKKLLYKLIKLCRIKLAIHKETKTTKSFIICGELWNLELKIYS